LTSSPPVSSVVFRYFYARKNPHSEDQSDSDLQGPLVAEDTRVRGDGSLPGELNLLNSKRV
jgi:hypothetical protein